LALNENLDYNVVEDEENIYIASKEFTEKHLKLEFKGKIRGDKLLQFVCKHPIYGDLITIVPHDALRGSIGSGIQPLCPAHYLDDLEVA
jgi:isoleucyl-tRNA synthetase